MAETNVVFTNNTTKLLYPKGQKFWSGIPVAAPGRIPPGSTTEGKQLATSEGSLKFATVYVDSEEELPTTRRFITAFDISAFEEYGPYGSDLPKNYSIILEQDESIKEVIVRHGFIVDAIGFVVVDKTGKITPKLFGGEGGNESRIPLLNDEYITRISGTYGKYGNSNNSGVVGTLLIHTNLKPRGYGPYGRGEQVQNLRNFASTNGKVIGFSGRHSKYLESVGVYLTNAVLTDFGPYGSQLPKNYSMVLGQDESIKEIIVQHGGVIDSIGFVVADKTGKTSTKIFGGKGGNEIKIPLKKDEYITQISGTYGKYFRSRGDSTIATLTIHTNLKRYGPYGKAEQVQNPHNFTSVTGPIVGFFGSHDDYLQSIGVYLNINVASKAYAEIGSVGPIDWNAVKVKLGQSETSVVSEDKVEATVYGNGDAGVVYSSSMTENQHSTTENQHTTTENQHNTQMAENNVVFTNNTTKMLYPQEQHFWSGIPLSAPGRIPSGSTAQGQQLATFEGSLKFATVYVDGEKELPATRKFITAFDISPFQEHGPYGSDLPINYSMILGQNESIKEIIVRHGFIVDAIGFVVADKTGTTSTNISGGNGGQEIRIPLQSDEYITKISGTYGKYANSNSGGVVATLILHTNLKPGGYGPYGRGELVQNPCNFASNTRGSIIGFFGRRSNYLESIGVYERGNVVTKEFGPYGSQSPKNYSMTLAQGESIKEIRVMHGFIVDSIGFVVADKKGGISTKIFGGSNGTETKISLKSNEYITQISGTYGKYQHSNSDNNVATLTIHTNLNSAGYGPYGRGEHVQNPRNFISPSSPVAGFFGRHDNYLLSVGVYLSTSAASKAYAESGPTGPIDWKMMEVKLGQSQPSVVYDGGKVVATVFGNGDAGVIYNET